MKKKYVDYDASETILVDNRYKCIVYMPLTKMVRCSFFESRSWIDFNTGHNHKFIIIIGGLLC